MAFSSLSYTADGVTVDYAVTFDYLDQSHIAVLVDKVRTTQVGSSYTFEWINANTIRVRTVVDSLPVPAGLEVQLIRETPISTPAVIFGGGASLSSENLNKNSQYLTFALQEATDANDAFLKLYLGAKSSAPSVDNAGDTLQIGAVYFDTNDKTPYYWTGSVWNRGDIANLTETYKNAAEAAKVSAEAAQATAEAARDAAQTSETGAAASETASAASEVAALNAKTAAQAAQAAAELAETNAAGSASSASTSASAAATSATTAQSAQSAAEAAQTAAESARNAAQTAQTAAEAARTGAETAETNASASATLAQEWAVKAEDIEVTPGSYSAFHWAQKAAASAANAATFDPSSYYTKTESDGRYATASHGHSISAITNLQTELDSKATLVGVETLTNKTLTDPKVNLGADATGDIYYRAADGSLERLPIGAADQALIVSSGVPAWGDPPSGGGPIDDQTFNASGTWTKPSSGTTAIIEVWGAGGGGGFPSGNVGGGGGGGGGYWRIELPLSSLSATETVTVGAGGAGGTSSGADGNNGGSSSFGSHLSVFGGARGRASGSGGAGGSVKGTGSITLRASDAGKGGQQDIAPTRGTTGGGGGGGNGADEGYIVADTQAGPGAASIYGGSGGGAGVYEGTFGGSSSGSVGGFSMYGGDGGTGASNRNPGGPATPGQQPGGGGGGGALGYNGADGADGRVRVRVY